VQTFTPEMPLYVDDVLLISSLGFDAATAIAAMRAGLSRPSPLPGFSVTAEDGDEMDVSGHPVSLLTHGFEGSGRYRQLLGRIFADVQSALRAQNSNVYLLVGVPDQTRYRDGINAESGAQLTEKEDAFNLFGETWQSIVDSSLATNGLADRFVATKIVELSVANTPRLLQISQEALKRDPQGCVVVVTVDTLADEPGLTWLYHTGRLKTAIYPVGTSPGECVNALFLSGQKTSPSSLRLDSVHYDVEEHDLFDDTPPQGRALSRLLQQFASGGEQEKAGKLWLISNLSGEQKSSFEWGMAQVHCQAVGVEINESPWLPGINVGDVGVAYMNLALAWVFQAIKRGYAMAPRCGITSLDHTGTRSLLSVSKG
jgi:3-oxoacyl-[acyl-carrier-protein] synthase-1